MSKRFDYVKYDAPSQARQMDAKMLCGSIESFIEQNLENGRAKSLALTKLEEVYMWIGKGIRDDQIARDAATELQEDRNNS